MHRITALLGMVLLACSAGAAVEDYDADNRDDTPPDIHYERGLQVMIPPEAQARFVAAAEGQCGDGCEADVAAHRVSSDAEAIVLEIADAAGIELARLVVDRDEARAAIPAAARLAQIRDALGLATPDEIVFATGRRGDWRVYVAAERHGDEGIALVHHVVLDDAGLAFRHGSRDVHNGTLWSFPD